MTKTTFFFVSGRIETYDLVEEIETRIEFTPGARLNMEAKNGLLIVNPQNIESIFIEKK